MNTEIYEGRRIDKIVIEEDLRRCYGPGGHLWFCRCDCGRCYSWKEWQLVKGVRTGELLCRYCTRLKRRFSQRKGFVYLIHQTGTDYYKIGISKNPEQRLSSLQCGRQTKNKLYFVKVIDGDYWIECQLHWKYGGQKQRGEWFEFNLAQVKDVTKVMGEMKLSQVVTKNL